MNKLDKTLKQCHKILLFISGISLAIIVVLSVLSVIGRYFLKTDLIPGVYNYIERIFFPVSTFCAFAASYGEGMWPAMDVILRKSKFKTAKIMKIFISITEMSIFTIMFIFVFRYVINSIKAGATILVDVHVWSMTPLLLLLIMAFLLLLIESFREFMRVLKADESNLLIIFEE